MTDDQLRNHAENYLRAILDLHQRNRWPVEPLATVLLNEGINLLASRRGMGDAVAMLRAVANELELEAFL